MNDDSLILQVAEEFTRGVRDGKLPDIEEYANRYPQLASRIRELFPTLMLLEGMAGTSDSTATQAMPSLLSRDSVFGNYRIVGEVGRGGMGIVYEAVHVLLERKVALKVLPVRTHASADQLERFFREARMAGGLHHTNIVPVFDVGQVAGTPYYAMQYIEGSGLDQIIRIMQSTSERGPMDPSARIEAGVPGRIEEYFRWVSGMGIQAAEGLAYAHERKIMHRDIKPSNLLLDKQGVLWISDFGLARKIEDPALTQSGTLLGTPRYMSPEQAEFADRPVDQRSDIYSLGATLYELLTCRPVFEGKTPREVLSQIITREPVGPRRLNPKIPVDLATIVMRAMAKQPEDRYQFAQDLADDLNHWQKMEPIKARPIGPLGRTVRWCRRNPRLAAITATAAAIIISLTGIYIANLTKKNQEIRAVLHRGELMTSAIQAALLDDLKTYVNRAKKADRIDRAMLGSQNVELLPETVNYLCFIDPWNQKPFPGLEQAITESENRALELAELAVNRNETQFAESVDLLGEYFDDKKDLDKAEMLYRQALALARQGSGDSHLELRLIDKLEVVLEKKAKPATHPEAAVKTAALYSDLLKLRREISPQDDVGNAILERNLGMALTESGQYEEAEKVLSGNYRLCLAELGKDNPSTQMAVRSLLSLYVAWKKQPEKISDYSALLPSPKVIDVQELGTMPFAPSQDGPFSAAWGGKEVWVFGHYYRSNPERVHGSRSSSWYWNDAGQKGDNLGPFQQRKDDQGYPLLLLPFTKDEDIFNLARSDPRCLDNCLDRWSIKPGPVIPLPGDKGALLLYSKSFIHQGDFGKTIGTSIARWEDPTAQAVRENLRPGTNEPTLLFQPPEPLIGLQAFVWDNYLYANGSRKSGREVVLARAPLDQALQRSAWRFYIGNGRWSEDWQQAVDVTYGSRGTTQWNWYLGKFTYIYNFFAADSLSIFAADRLEGQWAKSQDILLGQELNRKKLSIKNVIVHPELSQERGRVQYVTYQVEKGIVRAETRLVKLVFQ
jgi:serine/threonine protein kinase